MSWIRIIFQGWLINVSFISPIDKIASIKRSLVFISSQVTDNLLQVWHFLIILVYLSGISLSNLIVISLIISLCALCIFQFNRLHPNFIKVRSRAFCHKYWVAVLLLNFLLQVDIWVSIQERLSRLIDLIIYQITWLPFILL